MTQLSYFMTQLFQVASSSKLLNINKLVSFYDASDATPPFVALYVFVLPIFFLYLFLFNLFTGESSVTSVINIYKPLNYNYLVYDATCDATITQVTQLMTELTILEVK